MKTLENMSTEIGKLESEIIKLKAQLVTACYPTDTKITEMLEVGASWQFGELSKDQAISKFREVLNQ